jgi:hypothetical protein
LTRSEHGTITFLSNGIGDLSSMSRKRERLDPRSFVLPPYNCAHE